MKIIYSHNDPQRHEKKVYSSWAEFLNDPDSAPFRVLLSSRTRRDLFRSLILTTKYPSLITLEVAEDQEP